MGPHPTCGRSDRHTSFSVSRLDHVLAVFCGLVLASLGPALADQTDPRLKQLFGRLQDVTLPADIKETEDRIWTIWHEAPDEAAQALLDAGIKAMHGGNPQGAMKAFDEVIETAPDFAEGWNKRATLHYLMGNFERSLEDIARTLELEPRHFGALSGRGLVHAAMNNLEMAVIAFEEALAVHPKMVGPRVNANAIRKKIKEDAI